MKAAERFPGTENLYFSAFFSNLLGGLLGRQGPSTGHRKGAEDYFTNWGTWERWRASRAGGSTPSVVDCIPNRQFPRCSADNSQGGAPQHSVRVNSGVRDASAASPVPFVEESVESGSTVSHRRRAAQRTAQSGDLRHTLRGTGTYRALANGVQYATIACCFGLSAAGGGSVRVVFGELRSTTFWGTGQ